MLDYVYGHDEVVAQFVASLIPHCERGFGNCKTIGIIDEEGRLIGGAVFHHWDPDAGIIEISGAATSARWLSRGTMQRLFDYAFDECGVQMVVQRTPADAERTLGQLASFGYSFVLVPRLFGRDRDGVICCLTDDAWASNRFNRKRAAPRELILEEAA